MHWVLNLGVGIFLCDLRTELNLGRSRWGRGIFQGWNVAAKTWLWTIVTNKRADSGTQIQSVKLKIILAFVKDGKEACIQGTTAMVFCSRAQELDSTVSTLAWKIPWAEEPGRLQSMGSRRVGHNWVTSLSLFTFIHWRRKWQPTPVFLPGESQGRGSLVGCCLWGGTELDTTEAT